MEATSESSAPQKLTGKGQATRARILEHAAELIYAKGVHATNNELLRRAAGVSGSQLNHYFPTKESLVLAVIGWQADRVLTFLRSKRFANFESIGSLREWADYYIAYEHSYQEGCSLGSLASELIKTTSTSAPNSRTRSSSGETSSGTDSGGCRKPAASAPRRIPPGWPISCSPHSRAACSSPKSPGTSPR